MTATSIDQHAYSSRSVCKIAGCTYRQLDTWARHGWVTPDIADADGSGTARRWSPARVRDVALLAALMRLLHYSVVHDKWGEIRALAHQQPMPLTIKVSPGLHLFPGVLLADVDARLAEAGR